MSRLEPLRWTSAFVSHAGAVRPVNQDSWLEAPDLGLWAVADGMGGHEAGQIASRMIIDALDDLQAPMSCEAMVASVRDRLASVNRDMVELSRSRYEGRVIGSTVAVLIACGGGVVCLWAGDSRIYRWRAGRLEQLTRDHSGAEELVTLGLLDRAEVQTHSLANVVTRAVGAQPELAVDSRCEPVEPGDRFFLCSDGLNHAVADDEIAQALDGSDCPSVARALLDLALHRQASDNVTIGVVQAGETDDHMATLVPFPDP